MCEFTAKRKERLKRNFSVIAKFLKNINCDFRLHSKCWHWLVWTKNVTSQNFPCKHMCSPYPENICELIQTTSEIKHNVFLTHVLVAFFTWSRCRSWDKIDKGEPTFKFTERLHSKFAMICFSVEREQNVLPFFPSCKLIWWRRQKQTVFIANENHFPRRKIIMGFLWQKLISMPMKSHGLQKRNNISPEIMAFHFLF